MTSFNLHYLSESPFSKYQHILRFWELELQYKNLGVGGGHSSVQSITELMIKDHLLPKCLAFVKRMQEEGTLQRKGLLGEG